MSRQLASILVLFLVLAEARFAQAQQEGSRQQTPNTRQRSEKRPRLSLSERLQQFRAEVLGEKKPARRQASQQHRNNVAAPRQGGGMSNQRAQRSMAQPDSDSSMSRSRTPGDGVPHEAMSGGNSSSRRNTYHPSQPATTRPATVAPSPARSARPALTLQERLSAAGQNEPAKASVVSPTAEEAGTPADVEPSERAPLTARNRPLNISPTDEASKFKESATTEDEPAGDAAIAEDGPSLADDKSKGRENTLFSGQSALLSVDAMGPRKIMVGKEATFTVRVRNAGEAAANNVVITLNIPVYAELVGAQVSAGTTSAATGADRAEPFEWKIARLEAHGRQTLTLRLIPRKSAPLDLAAQWTCSPETSQTLVEVQEPKLLMALSGPQEVLFGQTKVYKLTISNPGNGDAENVVVSLVPIGRTTEATASHKLGTLRAGDSKAIEVELTARQAGAITIKAQAFADGGLRSDVTEQVLVRRANLRAEIEGPKVKYAGTNCTYRVRVTNIGNAVAENVQVAALLPPEAKYVNSSSGGRVDNEQSRVNWSAGSLQPGSERILEFQCSLQAAGENRVQVLLTGEDDLNASSITSTRVEAIADLKLEVRDPQGPVPVGEETVFEVVVRNRGTKTAEEVELVVFFSEGLEATNVQGGAYEIGRGQVVFRPIRSIAAGSESIYRVHTRADRSGNHVLRAELVCQSLGTKLTAEEATTFYGDEAEEALSSTPGDAEPHVASEPQATRLR